jgi:hypothetical protein
MTAQTYRVWCFIYEKEYVMIKSEFTRLQQGIIAALTTEWRSYDDVREQMERDGNAGQRLHVEPMVTAEIAERRYRAGRICCLRRGRLWNQWWDQHGADVTRHQDDRLEMQKHIAALMQKFFPGGCSRKNPETESDCCQAPFATNVISFSGKPPRP